MNAAVAPALSFNGVCKRFGDTVAANDVSFDVHGGEIVALLGENGAGKSTLIKILAGVYAADAGSITADGETMGADRSAAGSHHRIAFIHQDLGLIEWMTVAENIGLNRHLAGRWGLINWRAARRRAVQALARVGGSIDPDERVFNLSRTDKSLVAIARALTVDAKVLVLDEPTSSLPTADVQRLFDVLKGLREAGVGMIYVSHRLDEIPRIADRVAVMRDGHLIGVHAIEKVTTSDLITMIVGRTVKSTSRAAPPASDAATLLVLDQIVTDQAGPISMDLKSGEMVALTGLQGAGHIAIGRAIFGLTETQGGGLAVADREVTINGPDAAIAQGIGFTSSNRREESLALPMTVRENLFINPGIWGRFPLSWLSGAGEQREGRELVDEFDIQPPDTRAIMDTLSGGNQQKVVLARWRYCNPGILILEEPTLGVDVGSRAEIYEILFSLLRGGKAIILISSDFEEVAAIAGRALVLKDGQLAETLYGDDISIDRLTAVAAG